MQRPLTTRTPRAESSARHDRRPALALALLVVGATLGYGAAAQLVERPLLNPDELRYVLAARAVADGGWLELRGHGYGYGPVYPLVVAPVIAAAGDVEAAYGVIKVVNALAFALAAVPIYLLARRLLAPWWSIAVAALSLAIPSSIYTSLVLTESTAYLVASASLLAVVLALERASVTRQLAMLGAVGVAFLTRAQFASLLGVFLAGFLLLGAVDARRPPLRRAVARLWPTLAALALAVGALVSRALVSSPDETLGGYGDLWRGYDVASVGRLAVYHLAGWETYLFVVPLVVAPVVVVQMLRAARSGARREGAFVAVFLTANAASLVIAAAFASTPYGWQELHDRYVFYVAPLWLMGLCLWLARGLPRPPVPIAIGAALAVVLAALLPFGLLTGNTVFEAPPTALWSAVWDAVEGTPHLDGRRAYGLVVVALVIATAFLPRRLWPVFPALLVAGLGTTAVLAWHRLAAPSESFAGADVGARAWVDDALPEGARATKLYRSPRACPSSELTRHGLFLTELFNASVERVAKVRDSTPDGLPVDRVVPGADGRLLSADGSPLVAEYVVTQPELRLVGRRIGRGSGAGLVLWQTGGPVRLAEAEPASACR